MFNLWLLLSEHVLTMHEDPPNKNNKYFPYNSEKVKLIVKVQTGNIWFLVYDAR